MEPRHNDGLEREWEHFRRFGPTMGEAASRLQAFEDESKRQQREFHEQQKQQQVEFDEKQKQQRVEFNMQESQIERSLKGRLAQSLIQYGSAEEHQKRYVPAYAFPRFGQLPKEIQLRIWSLASRVSEPAFHSFTKQYMGNYIDGFWSFSMVEESSSIEEDRINITPSSVATLLEVCKDSRAELLKVYTYIGNSSTSRRKVNVPLNTLYDTFYMGGNPWSNFKILLDLLVEQSSPGCLRPTVRAHLNSLIEIQLLTVEDKIYASVPPSVWTDFRKLRKFTIVFEPTRDGNRENERRQGFMKPLQGSISEDRASKVYKEVATSFDAVKSVKPDWNIPEIEVLLWKLEPLDVEVFGDKNYKAEVDNSDEDPNAPYLESWNTSLELTRAGSCDAIIEVLRKDCEREKDALVFGEQHCVYETKGWGL